MKLAFTTSRSRKNSQGGYILLVLILFVALLTIAAAAIAPSIAFQVKRDREEELIHRGVQYSRAVRHYYKKFGRYPSRIEDLESTNNLRFLRKRYKDPITGNDFKVLHLGDVAAALIPGGAAGSLNPAAGPGGNQFGQPSNAFGGGSFGAAQAANKPAPTPTADTPNADGSANESNGSGQAPVPSPTFNPQQPGTTPSNNTDKLAGQTFGGGPIAGVVSSSKAESIREFNKKNHYNQWLFIYNPQSDRGGLLSTPDQPALQGANYGGAGMTAPNGSGGGFGNQGGVPGSPFGGSPQQPAQNSQPQQQPPQQQ